MNFTNFQTEKFIAICCDGREIAHLEACKGCVDHLEEIEPGAWRWVRKSEKPLQDMTMTLARVDETSYYLVPGLNYNGNGWGSGLSYTGWEWEGEPWKWAWHRTPIPACTYVETGDYAVAVFGEENGNNSCSLNMNDGIASQNIHWPEQEGPKVLSKYCWWEPVRVESEAKKEFSCVIKFVKVERPMFSVRELYDFTWRYFDRSLTMEKTPEHVKKLDLVFFRTLYHILDRKVCGFAAGLNWNMDTLSYHKHQMFGMGFVGQNGNIACALLRQYLKTGEEDLKDKAISTLDSWVKYAFLPNGLMLSNMKADPMQTDSHPNGEIGPVIDACNLGYGSFHLLEAYELTEKMGLNRPEYKKAGLGICDFMVKNQQKNGEFGRAWRVDGSLSMPNGTVGGFLIPGLIKAFEITGEQKYYDVAVKAFDCYYNEFLKKGYTTAGAMDTYCIDKESAAPLLRSALMFYAISGDKGFIDAAEDVAYYLVGWQYCHSVRFPKDSELSKLKYDTFGGTTVSISNCAIDPWGIYFITDFLKLAELTGNDIWSSRARALWYNGIQLLSDGTLVIRGKVRPAGSQDESARVTRWGRLDKRYFVAAEWLVSWPGAFRQMTLDTLEDWEILR
ncbi:MAG: hypothetical protein E7396_02835 [Ruminococcaceae bacterium]|nr:hypothetical protein [Oscillospiraceae bacterium]